MAGRLAGTQTFLCRIQSSSVSRQITKARRTIDAPAGIDTKSPPSGPDGKRVGLEMIVEIDPAA